MAKVIFSFEGRETHIQCLKEDKMRDICNRYSQKVDININSLYFLYGGNKVNLLLSFKEQANSMDNNRNIMNILVFQDKNEGLICQKCGAKINSDILNSIITDFNNQNDILIGIKNQINNLINIYDINQIISQIKLTKIVIDNLINENEKIKNKLQSLLNSDNIPINSLTQNLNTLNINQTYLTTFEITTSYNLNHNQEERLKNIIVEAVSKFPEYNKLAEYIANQLAHKNEVRLIVNVGERNKFNSTGKCSSCLAGNIGPYKITIHYFEN